MKSRTVREVAAGVRLFEGRAAPRADGRVIKRAKASERCIVVG
jgi:hypothetical protein